MSSNTKVSVSITTYNHGQFIAQALDSVLAQKVNFNFEILLGEDDSSDGTREICIDYANRYPDKIKLFLHDRADVIHINGRPTGRRNLLNNLEQASGDYVALLDGDDYWTDLNKLQIQVDYLDSNSACSLCFHNVIMDYGNDSKSRLFHLEKIDSSHSTTDLLKSNFIPTPSVLLRRSSLPNPFPHLIYLVMPGDWLIHIILSTKGSIDYIDRVMGVYRMHGKGVWSSLTKEQALFFDCDFYCNIFDWLDKKFADIILENLLRKLYELSQEYKNSNKIEQHYLLLNEIDVVKILQKKYEPSNKVNNLIENKYVRATPKIVSCIISIIICTYNRSSLLADSIKAIAQQDFTVDQYEIIVVDNNSTDNTRAVAEALINTSPVRIRYILEKKQGLSFARNTGIENAAGEIVAFVDDDIDAERNWLKAIVSAFNDPKVACAGGPIRPVWPIPGEKPAWLTNSWVSYLTVSEFESAKKTGEFVWPDTPWGANISFRKNVFDTVGVFPTNLGRIGNSLLSNEEVNIGKKIVSAGFRIAFAPDAVIHHKIPPERLTKQYFHHRTYWQGISDAILDAETDASVYEGMRKRIHDFASNRSVYGANNFTTNCSKRIALGYLYQITCKEKDSVRKNNLSVFRTLSKYLSEYRTIIHGAGDLTPSLKSNHTINPSPLAGMGILIVDYEVPQHDKYAGSRTTFMYLQLLAKIGLKVYFLPDDFERREPYSTALEDLGIKILHGEWFKNNWQHWILENALNIQYILFNRPNITIKYIDFIRANTGSVVLFQGHDLHYLRLMRKYEVDGDNDSLREAEEYRDLEFNIIEQSDIILTFSEYEKQIISKHFPNKSVHSVPLFFYEQFPEISTNFCDRNNIMFIGGCYHKPNLDAILWFCREIFPIVRKKHPQVVFYIIGTSPPPEVTELESDNIKVIGQVTDYELENYYRNIRLVVVPLRFGAGVKGKTVESIYRGVPIVTTSIGLEGILDIESIVQPFDEADSFAMEIIKIYGDCNRLMLMSTLYREFSKKYFHIDGARMTLESILRSKTASECHRPLNEISPASRSVRIIAFHLPQFHPIPENDAWWGTGFTEWTNVSKAEPLFDGHQQPRIPADLGLYDLRRPEARKAQAEMAREYGIEGFCYWHYWFNGKRLLELPVNEILTSGKPDYPFCLAWANETWSRRWLGEEKDILMQQTYSHQDDLNHISWLIKAFSDPRYITMDGRPVFLIYRPTDLPDPKSTTDLFRAECMRCGINNPYLIGINSHCWDTDCRTLGFDATLLFMPQLGNLPEFMNDEPSATKLERNRRFGIDSSKLKIYDYAEAVKSMLSNRGKYAHPVIPSLFVGWDNTPRRGENSIIIVNNNPKVYQKALTGLIQEQAIKRKEERFVFLNAWNEWAEGNYLEPDTLNGLAFLEATKKALSEASCAEHFITKKEGFTIKTLPPLPTPDSSMRTIAFHLPQFHTIPENDEWWGNGFTEWTNVSKAAPYFPGHYQPHIPSDLGYYDLSNPDSLKMQAALAKKYGIHGFCFYHYWFNGKLLLETPLHQMLKSGEPDFPFCLCWANENWTRAWDGRSGEILIGQEYTDADDVRHIYYLASFFEDRRYIRVNGKPLFLVYRANNMPDPSRSIKLWRDTARKIGIGEIYVCRVESFHNEHSDPTELGFDAAIEFQPDWKELDTVDYKKLDGDHLVYDYADVVRKMIAKSPVDYKRFPSVFPSWDNSARRKTDAIVFNNSTPLVYQIWLKESLRKISQNSPDERIIFINAWNEWGEGNHLEPDQKFGKSYLEATYNALAKTNFKVSIILSVNNQLPFLMNCLETLLSKNFSVPVEIIVVDNGSTDGSKDFIAVRHGSIKVIDNIDNLGYMSAFKQGATIAQGEYMLFLYPGMQINNKYLNLLLNISRYDVFAAAVTMTQSSVIGESESCLLVKSDIFRLLDWTFDHPDLNTNLTKCNNGKALQKLGYKVVNCSEYMQQFDFNDEVYEEDNGLRWLGTDATLTVPAYMRFDPIVASFTLIAHRISVFQKTRQIVELYQDNALVDIIIFTQDNEKYPVKIPISTGDTPIRIQIRSKYYFVPAEISESDDQRKLSLLLRDLRYST